MRRRKSPKAQKETLVFILIASLLMVAADQIIFGGTRPYIEDLKREYRQVEADPSAIREEMEIPPASAVEERVTYDPFFDDLARPIFAPDAVPEEGSAFQPQHTGPKPKIALIIDDIGMRLSGSRRAVNLPVPVTLAFLPYADAAPDLAKAAKEKGHELIIHIPMEAMQPTVSLGGMGLTSDMEEEAFHQRLEDIFASFDGYVGANNHMGSKLTQDSAAMARLMGALKERNLFFVDSKTISSSVAARTARQAGLAHASRDVFLDHEDTPDFVRTALQKLENTARTKGHAIAIGHPKPVTLEVLEDWIPLAKARGFDFVPVSEVLNRPQEETNLMASDLNEIVPAAGPQTQPP